MKLGDLNLPRFDRHANTNEKRESRWKRKGSTLSIKRSFDARLMAGYGTARSLARRLGENRLAETLQQTLNEEGEADKKLSSIAESKVNVAAGSRAR
jgi:ferritin-like metal-binding protein YciE